MELGEYFGKVFGKVFNGTIYWPTLVLMIILGVVMCIVGVILFFTVGTSVVTSLMSAYSDPALLANTSALSTIILSLLGAMTGVLVVLGIFALVITYLSHVIYAFVVIRIQATEGKAKSLGFFEGLGTAFGRGFKLFIACLIYMIVIGIVMLIVWLLSLIPIAGFILAILLSIVIMLYAITGMWVLVGSIGSGESFGKSLGQAFAKPFTKGKLWLYTLLFLLILGVISTIASLIAMIPLLGWIAYLFIIVGTYIFAAAIAYFYAKE